MILAKMTPIAASVALVTALMAGGAGVPLAHAASGDVTVKADGIGGVVASAKGPEAGVWVIAETKDLGVPYKKIVVTDDQGRYLLPALPKANYKVWVRGYGLVDSKPVAGTLGSHINLTAVIAPDAKSAAQYYPATYWLSLLKLPAEDSFPGTGPQGNGIAPAIKSQQQWVSNLKQCTQCHQLGDPATRELANNTVEGWHARVQQARANGDPVMGDQGGGYMQFMNRAYTSFGRDGAGKMFASWTQDIAKGAVPAVAPPRPQGIERNMVLTLWAWGNGSYFHDEVATDRRNPHINANGPIYGTQILVGKFGILDPVKNTYSEMDVPKGYDGYVHTVMMDQKGRVWLPDGGMSFQPAEKQRVKREDFCTNPLSGNKFASYSPITGSAAYIDMYDPKTKQMTNIPSCAGGGHVWFGNDKDNTLFITGGGLNWIATKVWDETHDPQKAQGWCPLVINTKEKGLTKVAAKSDDGVTIDPDRKHWNMPGEIVDPTKDTNIGGGTYGLGVNPVDGTIWAGLPRYPGGIVRLDRGSAPPETCKTEFYEPPKGSDGKYLAFAPHDLNLDSKGIAWVSFTSGQIGRFDRSKCKVLIGPSATGQHCQEGWKIWDSPSPRLGGANTTAESTDYIYQTFVDRFNTFGLGKDVPMFPGVNSDAIYAFMPDTEKWVTVRVPSPMGFFTRWIDGRIDDEKGGWKGRGAWATFSSVSPWHQEDEAPQLVHFQVRPNPLAE